MYSPLYIHSILLSVVPGFLIYTVKEDSIGTLITFSYRARVSINRDSTV